MGSYQISQPLIEGGSAVVSTTAAAAIKVAAITYRVVAAVLMAAIRLTAFIFRQTGRAYNARQASRRDNTRRQLVQQKLDELYEFALLDADIRAGIAAFGYLYLSQMQMKRAAIRQLGEKLSRSKHRLTPQGQMLLGLIAGVLAESRNLK